MNVRMVEPDGTLGCGRGEAVVCIPVHNAHELFVGCLQSVLAHTPAEVPILICDDASPDARTLEFVRQLDGSDEREHRLFYLLREQNLGFPANANGALALAAPADVAIVNSDCVVADGWLDGLRDAAYSDSRVATVTALTNHGSIVSVPTRNKPAPELPEGMDLEQAAATIRRRSLRIRPRLPTAIGHCVYLRRSAIELVGDFDLAFSPGYGEEVDYSQRCLRAGLSHVLADDVLVLHHGGGSFGAALENPHQKRHERLLATRYPYYHQNVVAAAHGVATPLSRALGVARRALEGLSVVIDGRILAGPMTGTQLHVLELIAALARSDQVRVTTIVPDAPGAYAERALSALDRVTVVSRAQLEERRSRLKEPRADVVHRPFQVSSHEDLAFLSELGERLIVTHQDMISYCNPSYFKDFQAWEGYRRLTREALAVADRVLFFSAFARDDALAEDLVEPSRASVVHIGVDHAFALRDEQPVAPADAGRLPDGAEAILCIGTDFRHKNRTFALRLLAELRRRHDWRGYLLLVGPRVTSGSSIPDERELLADSPGLGDAVLRFGAVSDAEKAWLYERSRLVVYPTVHEGFGLIPFEAAEHGVPCMWADGTALSEVLPAGQASIVAWNAADSADRALGLLRDDQLRADNLRAIKDAAAKLTWDATAAALVDLYSRTCDAPAAPASGFERSDGLMTGVFSEDAIRLMGPDGALPEDVERPLLALATHRQLGAPMFTAIKLGYRASFRLRRWRRNGGDQDGGG